jgi:hypothetical protein
MSTNCPRDETNHWDVPAVWCLWHLILALAKGSCQGEHEIKRSGFPPKRPVDNGVVGGLKRSLQSSRAIGASGGDVSRAFERREGGTAIS